VANLRFPDLDPDAPELERVVSAALSLMKWSKTATWAEFCGDGEAQAGIAWRRDDIDTWCRQHPETAEHIAARWVPDLDRLLNRHSAVLNLIRPTVTKTKERDGVPAVTIALCTTCKRWQLVAGPVGVTCKLTLECPGPTVKAGPAPDILRKPSRGSDEIPDVDGLDDVVIEPPRVSVAERLFELSDAAADLADDVGGQR